MILSPDTPARHRPRATRRRVAAVVSLAALFAATASAQELNSERIARTFGSYGVEVLEQDETVRLSNLYSLERGQRICRTLAIVQFNVPVPAALLDAHLEVVAGGSLGAVLTRRGWDVRKINRHIGSFAADTGADRIAGLMGIELPASLAIHVYRLYASAAGTEYDYATIVELHHPDYLLPDALRAAYATLPAEPMTTTQIREIAGRTRQRLGRERSTF